MSNVNKPTEFSMSELEEELKIIKFVFGFIPMGDEFKKNLNIWDMALALKPRLLKIAHNIVDGDLKEKELELKVGDYVEIRGKESHPSYGIYGYITKLVSETQAFVCAPAAPTGQIFLGCFEFKYLKKVDRPQLEWQPKFKVGDWVENTVYNGIRQIHSICYEEKAYYMKTADGSCSIVYDKEEYLRIWPPMQELKERNETQARSIITLMAEVKDLKSKVEELKTDLPKGVRAKHKWVELSEFVKNNPEWVNNNFETIIAHAELFYKKGDLLSYSYDRWLNKFIFKYAPGITKLMMPLCCDIEK